MIFKVASIFSSSHQSNKFYLLYTNISQTIIFLQVIHSVKQHTPESSAKNDLLRYIFRLLKFLDLLTEQDFKLEAFGALFNLYFICKDFGLDSMGWEDSKPCNCTWIQSYEVSQTIQFNYLLAKST